MQTFLTMKWSEAIYLKKFGLQSEAIYFDLEPCIPRTKNLYQYNVYILFKYYVSIVNKRCIHHSLWCIHLSLQCIHCNLRSMMYPLYFTMYPSKRLKKLYYKAKQLKTKKIVLQSEANSLFFVWCINRLHMM